MEKTREWGLFDEANETLGKWRQSVGGICEEVIRVVETTVRFLAASGIEGIKFDLRYIHDSLQKDRHDGYKFKPEDWQRISEAFKKWMADNGFDANDGNRIDATDVTLRWGDGEELLDATSNGAADTIFFPNHVFMRNGWTIFQS